MANPKKTLKKLQQKLNQTTFLLVVGMGLLALMTILSEPSRGRPTSLSHRDLASVSDSAPRNSETNKAASVLNLKCGDGDNAVSWTQQIRLKGHSCQATGETTILTTQIKNTRNGYVATVFHQDREFSTDFIQLSEGENHLLVKHTLSDGQTEEHKVSVTRQ
jgi:hypothetical protein